MTRVVMIVDADTGRLIDVAGNNREGGRYSRFVKRLLSADGKNLDYGIGENDSLTVSKGGYRGKEINLKAATVNVDGELKINGRTIAEMASEASGPSLDYLRGTEGEISVKDVYAEDPDTGEGVELVQISLDSSVTGRMRMIDDALEDFRSAGYVKKSDLAAVIENISFGNDTLESLSGKMQLLVKRIAELAGVDLSSSSPYYDSSSSSSSSSSPSPEEGDAE